MNTACAGSSTWHDALTLAERSALARTGERATPTAMVDADLARRRLQRWRSQSPFTTESLFAQRLAMDGLSEEDCLVLLGERAEIVHADRPTVLPWATELAAAFARPVSSASIPLPEALRDQDAARFLDVIAPLIGQGRARVRAGVQALLPAHAAAPFDPTTVEDLLFAALPGRLMMMVGRTLLLELHVARLQGLLHGETAAERFASFLDDMRRPHRALALLGEYPVLARQLVTEIDRWVACSLEFLHRLCADWRAICTAFSPEADPGLLVEVNGGVGDRHRGGRAVLIARFTTGFPVVYKPKSLAIEGHFQDLLRWLNGRGDHPTFRTLTVLDRGSYGWVECVTARGCASLAELERFYQRQGGYLALLYALEATDFHFENLIAAGEHPVLLDLEALFHPRVGRSNPGLADDLAASSINNSVLRVGLLPHRAWSNADGESVDISGLGAAEGQLTPFGVPQWEGAGTDEMRLVCKRMAMPGGQNQPTLDGAAVDVRDYAEAVADGFASVYRTLVRHRAELLADDGPLARFARDEVRVIVRPTRTYGTLLRESFHPDVLRNALDRDRLLDRLWVGIEQCPYLARVIPAERSDLLQGDIPLFTTSPCSRDVWSSSGERIASFFDEPGMDLVRRRVRQLDEHDLAQQLWIVRASFATLSTDLDHAPRANYRPATPCTRAERAQLLAGARAIGDRLEARALRGERDVSWIGLRPLDGGHWSLAPLGMDLYDGVPGVALFLAYLGSVTGEERYTALARAALATLRGQVARRPSSIGAIGGFTGWGGIIYLLAHLTTVWDQPALLGEAEAALEHLFALIEQDKHNDIIAGVAGCIGGLLSLHACAPSRRTLAALVRCGDRLIARAQRMAQGIGWVAPSTGTRALAGFSHGAAGMAWALLAVAATTGEERFRSAALDAIAYERSLFSPDAGNWPDLREHPTGQSDQDVFMTAWCHGAPGIGLARLASLRRHDDAATRAEIDTALRTTLAQGFGRNHSLCHGDLGNLELLIQASQTLDDLRWRDEVGCRAAMILESIGRQGWLCANPVGVESPGLMTGLAGIGYELLRLAEPERVPSVLVLAPPVL